MIKHIQTVDEFNKAIKGEKVLVDFYATWCGPCNMLTPVIEEIVEENTIPNLEVIKVDVDELPEIAQRFKIQYIPTLMIYENGEYQRMANGYQNKGQLLRFIK